MSLFGCTQQSQISGRSIFEAAVTNASLISFLKLYKIFTRINAKKQQNGTLIRWITFKKHGSVFQLLALFIFYHSIFYRRNFSGKSTKQSKILYFTSKIPISQPIFRVCFSSCKIVYLRRLFKELFKEQAAQMN